MRNVVDIQDLRITFATDAGHVPAVKGIDLDIRAGEILALVGESGSGKTVTARSIIGLLPETALVEGAIVLSNKAGTKQQDVLKLSAAQLREARGQDAAMVFQEPSTALNPVYPIGWQIVEGIRVHHKMGRRAAKRRAIEILAKVGIPDPEQRFKDYPHQFSGGQKQRIVIAMALVLEPGLIIADEPTTALDVTVQAEILDLLRELKSEFDTSILIITHNMGVVADVADRVAVMYRGELIEQNTATELFHNPQQEYTRKLLAAVPKLGSGQVKVSDRPTQTSEAELRSEPLVKAENLVITYPGGVGKKPFQAINGVSFEIAPGEVLGMVGESGSGKTTIGRAIAGLTEATGGSLQVLGTEMVGMREKDFKPKRKDLGFVFQDPASSFNPHLTIAECIAEPLVVHGYHSNVKAALPKAKELLEAVELPAEFAGRYPHELSGGQRQRVSLARALSLEPKLVIADEPTSALDVSVQATVLELFSSLQRELGFAALFISHDLAVVEMMSHDIGVLYHGDLLEYGPAAEVLANPQHTYTKKLLMSLPYPDPVEQARRREELRELR